MRPALSSPPRTTELPWHAEPGDAEALSGLSEVEHGGPQGRTRCRSPNKRCSHSPALTGRSAHRKGPSGFSEWTDMETVAVMSGTGAGAEDALPGPAGPKDD